MTPEQAEAVLEDLQQILNLLQGLATHTDVMILAALLALIAGILIGVGAGRVFSRWLGVHD